MYIVNLFGDKTHQENTVNHELQKANTYQERETANRKRN